MHLLYSHQCHRFTLVAMWNLIKPLGEVHFYRYCVNSWLTCWTMKCLVMLNAVYAYQRGYTRHTTHTTSRKMLLGEYILLTTLCSRCKKCYIYSLLVLFIYIKKKIKKKQKAADKTKIHENKVWWVRATASLQGASMVTTVYTDSSSLRHTISRKTGPAIIYTSKMLKCGIRGVA